MVSEYVARQRSNALITAMVGKDFVDIWWNSPNKAFDLKTPSVVWSEDYHKVYDYLIHMADPGW